MFQAAQEGQSVCEKDTVKKIDQYTFRTNEILGKGNFSIVYSGLDSSKGRPVAIKVVRLATLTSSTSRRLLENQVEILKKLSHPNLIQCHDVLFSVNNCYIVTEVCERGDLERLLRSRGKMDEREAAKIIRDVYKGLLHLHSLSIVHRDLKVANIFLGQGGVAKIADFGFAVKASGPFKDINIGSPIYMSPESLLRYQYSSKSDVWAFGILLYQLMHNDTPLSKCKTEEELKRKVLDPVRFHPHISPQLRELIEMCLHVNPQKRLSMQDMGLTKFMSRLALEESSKKQGLPSSLSVHSTNISESMDNIGGGQVMWGQVNYPTAIALLHYCRLIHKTHQACRNPLLSAWLLNVSEAMVRCQIAGEADELKLVKLRQVIGEYHLKYIKEHADLRMEMGLEDAVRGLEQMQVFSDDKRSLAMLLKETRLLKRSWEAGRLEWFGVEGQSKEFLDANRL